MAICLMSLPAYAETDKRQQKKQNREMNIEAEILDTREVKFKNSQEEHLVAKVELLAKDGKQKKQMFVDFGPVSTMREQGSELKKGDRVRAKGQEGKIDKKPVLFIVSYDLDKKSRMQNPSRTERARNVARSQTSMSNPELNAIEGEIVAMKDVKVKQLDEKQRLFRIKSRDKGRNFVISAGSRKELKDLSLDVGDTVLVRGIGGKINNRRVVFATRVAKVVNVERKAPKS